MKGLDRILESGRKNPFKFKNFEDLWLNEDIDLTYYAESMNEAFMVLEDKKYDITTYFHFDKMSRIHSYFIDRKRKRILYNSPNADEKYVEIDFNTFEERIENTLRKTRCFCITDNPEELYNLEETLSSKVVKAFKEVEAKYYF